MKKNIKIIYAEDEQKVRESIHRVLSRLFENIHSFENGLLALEHYKEFGADIIITDINMPVMDGFELIQGAKKINESVPVIIATAFSDNHNLLRALDLQVTKLLNKPIELEDLINSINHIKDNIFAKNEIEYQKKKLEKFKEAIEQNDILIHTDSDLNIKNFNDISKKKLDLDKGINLKELLPPNIIEQINKKAEELENFTTVTTIEDKSMTFSLTSFPSEFHQSDGGNEIEEITLLLKDITDTIRKKEALIKALYTDSLTSLPNRASLIKDLETTKGENQGLVIIDINSFSDINSFYGIEAADNILIELADNIKEFMDKTKKEYHLYRLDADRFGFIIKHDREIDDELREEAKIMTNALIKFIEDKPYKLADDDFTHIFVTMGRSCKMVIDLISEALLSLEYAKTHNLKNVCFLDYQDEILKFEDHLKMQTIIKKALDEDKVVPFFQPIVNKDKEIEKYEALARIVDGDIIYTPWHFMEVSKKGVLYNHITTSMIKKVFDIFSRNKYKVSINLSLLDIVNEEILEFIKNMFEKYPMMKDRVTFELLESESFDNVEKTNEVCSYLRSLGADIAIDDFGSGYSNFGYFADIDIDILKIDGVLTKKALENNGRIILKNIVSMAKDLKCKTIIEFVENEELFNHLKALDIDYFQGYYFSEPKLWSEL